MKTPELDYITTLPLFHNGDCSLLGVTNDFTVYVEEIYGADGWLAQHAIRMDGTISSSIDENFGAATELSPLSLPTNLVEPQRGWNTMALNFAGPRHRGLRSPERLDELIRPFSVQEKIALSKHLQINAFPPFLLGLAESYVLAEAPVHPPNLFFVCRRVRIAYVLPEERIDGDGEPYDYDTLVLYAAHFFDGTGEQEPALSDTLAGWGGIKLNYPMDCLIYKDHLFVADGGSEDRNSAVHIWHIRDLEPKLSDKEMLQRRLYG
jgi:hypothetical protein